MGMKPKGYQPALGYDWLLPLYDPLFKWFLREDSIKRRLVAEAGIRAGHRVLDVGCGTATLTLLVKSLFPDAEVLGLDGDPKALAIGRRKARKAGLEVTFDEGLSYKLSYPDGSFDRVLSSLMLHHLTREHKMQTLNEIWRVLKPGGELYVLDFGKPSTWIAHALHIFHREERIRDNIEDQLLTFFRDARFLDVKETGREDTIIGSVSFYRGSKGSDRNMSGSRLTKR